MTVEKEPPGGESWAVDGQSTIQRVSLEKPCPDRRGYRLRPRLEYCVDGNETKDARDRIGGNEGFQTGTWSHGPFTQGNDR